MAIAAAIVVLIGLVVAVVAFTGADDQDVTTAAGADDSGDDDAADRSDEDDGSDDAPADPEPTTEPSPTPEPTAEPTLEPRVAPSVDDLARSVVQVQLLLGDQITCTGSGTIVEADGTVLTNSHVIAQSPFCPHDRIGVAITDRPEQPPVLAFEAELLVDDAELDLAVIRIARTLDGEPVTQEFPVVEIGDSDTLSLGDRLRVIGYPGIGGETITFTEGTISGFVSVPGIGDRSWLKTDATISGGNSGGLAVDGEGFLVGIPTIVGTGDGLITDCRVVNDTNGDGRIDQTDNCVPVGGFINGIRPVNLAEDVLTAAATATPIQPAEPMVAEPMAAERPVATDGVWSLSTTDGIPDAPVTVVQAGVPQLCLSWDFEAVPPGAPVEIVWLIDGTPEPDAGFVGVNEGQETGGFFSCITNDAGLAGGIYEVGWFVDDEPVFADGIYVGGNRTPITLTVLNATDTALCVVQFAPSGTITFGLNRIAAPIPPGGTFDVVLASGRYDGRVIDCDGALLIEDTEGADIDTDSTLTVS
ncbi:MAG: trypsin-like peptidase domain-containing protein [Acidimicrobiales bacterium]